MGKLRRQTRPKAKRSRREGNKPPKTMPKALRVKLKGIAYSKTVHGFVPEDSSTTYEQTGLYVPIDVRTAVELESQDTSDARKQAVAQKDARDRRKARDLLLREFPNMPKSDLNAVLNHAFLKGSRRVGKSGKIASEEEKVRLAIEAHIRHVHTEYDAMIKRGMTRERARENIWGEVVTLRDSWKK
ncbi:uncharacterized protein GIQ15_03826 [Arthroderma uncinatum]|uniref:uncharacterized protein n=1 Tax=Arthroderma uncinatum TaxID=74035 RepID=UPI00144ADA6F|nr:uncharacterized protein GIQ15_03826 [Arthroderma uncinatum]KAF3481067.1 hypothetical protein GIQ15_03826 [Arthroderma uncinatum]